MAECIREITPLFRLHFLCDLFTESYGRGKAGIGGVGGLQLEQKCSIIRR
jgi:hypothetical protein